MMGECDPDYQIQVAQMAQRGVKKGWSACFMTRRPPDSTPDGKTPGIPPSDCN